MHSTAGIRFGRTKVMLMGSSMFAAMVVIAPSLANAQAVAANGVESVTVTGYAASLLKATDAHRDATNFTDSVFAEDMGKFPDTNIAESLNRIPGVTISREIDGSGVQVSIRGLGTNFTKVTLNNAQIAVASTGGTDGQNANREVDLNMFPTELFTQLTVAKSPTPDMIEGGAAGNVNLRSARPFDQEGFRVTYNAQAIDNNNAPAMGYRGSVIVSDTWGPFGALIGISGVHNRIYTSGWEDGNSGWTNPALTAAQCSQTPACNTTGGGNFTIPASVPANVTTGGLVPGTPVTAAYLAQLNPGTSNFQIDNGLIPRLGRSMYEDGHRDRYNGVASFEYRPSDGLHFYLDMIGGRTYNEFDRSDIDWVGRNGSVIPINEKVDANNVVTSGTFANAQFFLEARPYKERADFFSINPGMEWELGDKLHYDLQFNWSRSNFFRDSPTILVNTPLSAGYPAGTPGPTAPAGGVFVTFNNPGVLVPPTITTNIDLNNPANFIWSGGRVNLDEEKRVTFTKGVHTNLAWGDDHFTLKGGLAFDDVGRTILGLGNSQPWQNATCGNNPSQYLPPPNPQPSCSGLNIPGSQASVLLAAPAGPTIPSLPGYGTGFSAGFPPLTYSGSLVPQSALASYLRPGPAGFIAVNYPAFKTATNYGSFAANAVGGTGSNTGASSGIVEEKNYGAYLQTSGFFDIHDHKLRYNAGVRWVYTNQLISGPVTIVDPRNSALAAGGQYPNTFPYAVTKHNYQAFLPSVNAVYEVSDDFQVRAAISRTMTRPNPTVMLPGLNFSDQAAASATLGNPGLKPFFSNNIDLGAEYYSGGAGVFSVAVFRKALSGFTTTQTSTVPFSFLSTYGVQFATLSPTQQAAITLRGGPTVATINLAQQVNASGLLTVDGMEFNWVQPLDFLLDDYGLPGFGFTANLTILDQKGSGSAPAIATGISPYQYNLTGYYDHNGISFRMSYVFNDKTYQSGSNQQGICLPSTANPACPGGAYLYGAAYGQMDISSSLRLSNIFGEIPTDPDITFDIQNVTDSKLISYFNFPNAIHSYYNQGQTFMFGLRGTW